MNFHVICSFRSFNHLNLVVDHTISQHEDPLLISPLHANRMLDRLQNVCSTKISVEFLKLIYGYFDVFLIKFDNVLAIDFHQLMGRTETDD